MPYELRQKSKSSYCSHMNFMILIFYHSGASRVIKADHTEFGYTPVVIDQVEPKHK